MQISRAVMNVVQGWLSSCCPYKTIYIVLLTIDRGDLMCNDVTDLLVSELN